ncbi:hypothetical protein EHP00_1195 [Ecytonucleospora hepatopenaei]|uniref:Uncharacterized protein n=1 Tax=Ecytonucleospora hepatopenaei TaxID=646526 RepID=A0A1W0E871_9MICR|nr:hypothetical protein EHP00_1195 [Ecytonucleospora hepatopenaei]
MIFTIFNLCYSLILNLNEIENSITKNTLYDNNLKKTNDSIQMISVEKKNNFLCSIFNNLLQVYRENDFYSRIQSITTFFEKRTEKIKQEENSLKEIFTKISEITQEGYFLEKENAEILNKKFHLFYLVLDYHLKYNIKHIHYMNYVKRKIRNYSKHFLLNEKEITEITNNLHNLISQIKNQNDKIKKYKNLSLGVLQFIITQNT